MNEIESLRLEVAELRRQISATDDWANGIQQALVVVLPFLLRGHPEAGKVGDLLRKSSERYDELIAHPDKEDAAELHEAGKMLYRQLAILGVWPGVDPAAAAQQTLDRYGVAPSQE
jgi:hypothetical protein